MRAAVFHLRDAGSPDRSCDTHSSLLTFLFFRFLSKRRISSSVGCLVGVDHAFLAHQPRDVFLPVLARVATHDALHGRVGFQRRAVDAHRLAREQLLLGGDPQHELKHLVEHFLRQALAGVVSVEWSGVASCSGMPRNCRRARLSAHRQAMPRWTVDALEVADQQHAKVHARRDRRLAALFFLLVILLAATFDPAIESASANSAIEFLDRTDGPPTSATRRAIMNNASCRCFRLPIAIAEFPLIAELEIPATTAE